MSDPKITMAHCNTCGGDRNHTVLHVVAWPLKRYEMLRCRGCDSVTLRHTSWLTAERTDEPTVVYYPPAVARRQPEWMFNLWLEQPVIESLLSEIYVALQNDSRQLAGMGVRALVEQVMIDKVKDQGTFAKTLAAFEQTGYISARQAKTLGDILDAGHATIHRGWVPSEEDLGTLLDVTETMIETVYFHEDRARALKEKVPPRPR